MLDDVDAKILLAENDRLAKELTEARAANERLQAAIKTHHAQKADDRCWIDDFDLYKAAGLPMHDPFVGDKAAMLENCKRFIKNRCGEGGDWKSYAELEKELAEASAANERLQAEAAEMRDILESVRIFLEDAHPCDGEQGGIWFDCQRSWAVEVIGMIDDLDGAACQSILRRLEAGQKCYGQLLTLSDDLRSDPEIVAAIAAYDAAEKGA